MTPSCGSSERARGAASCAGLALLGLALALSLASPSPLTAQRATTIGLRGGAGLDESRMWSFHGQLELTELGGSSSVQVALGAFATARATDDYRVPVLALVHEYREESRVWGVALLANYLARHASRGPYLVGGLGVGYLWVDWRLETTDARVGSPLPEGGSYLEEEGPTLSTLLNLGVGQRLHGHLDVRAQLLTTVVPSTEERDLMLLPVLSFTTGIAF
jgi:hypothetical protein